MYPGTCCFYGAVRNGFEGRNIITRGIERGGPWKSRLFWALKWHERRECLLGQKSLWIFDTMGRIQWRPINCGSTEFGTQIFNADPTQHFLITTQTLNSNPVLKISIPVLASYVKGNIKNLLTFYKEKNFSGLNRILTYKCTQEPIWYSLLGWQKSKINKITFSLASQTT
jgi:hypothetical protein